MVNKINAEYVSSTELEKICNNLLLEKSLKQLKKLWELKLHKVLLKQQLNQKKKLVDATTSNISSVELKTADDKIKFMADAKKIMIQKFTIVLFQSLKTN